MTEEEKEREEVLKSFDRAEKRAKIRLVFSIIGFLIELFFYGAVVYLLIKQCS